MGQRQTLKIGLVLLLLGLLVSIVVAQVSSNFDAKWSRLAGGGGDRQSANHQIHDIVGQWLSLSPTSTNSLVVTDFFWSGDIQTEWELYLPLLLRTS
jgi:hypothetical protein